MKKHTDILTSIILLFLLFGIVRAEETLVQIPYQATYWVQPGDTLLGIGGSSFMQIYNHNLNSIEKMDHVGKPNPNRIVQGTRLIIPAGAYVTHRVAAAINAQSTTRQKARQAIQKARQALGTLDDAGYFTQPGYRKGVALLQQAVQLADHPPGFANINLLQAYELAVQAERYLDTDIALLDINRDISRKNAKTQKELSKVNEEIGRLKQTTLDLKLKLMSAFKEGGPPAWIAAVVLMTVTLLSVLWRRSRRKFKELRILKHGLIHHQKGLTAFQAGHF